MIWINFKKIGMFIVTFIIGHSTTLYFLGLKNLKCWPFLRDGWPYNWDAVDIPHTLYFIIVVAIGNVSWSVLFVGYLIWEAMKCKHSNMS